MIIVATVTATQVDDQVVMNLSLVVKCLTESDRQCASQLHKIHWPGIAEPHVKMPDHMRGGIRGPFALVGRDLMGRTVYELELLKSLNGTDTIVVNSMINGRIVESDLEFLDIMGFDLLESTYRCETGALPSRTTVHQVICEEEMDWYDRLSTILPLLGG